MKRILFAVVVACALACGPAEPERIFFECSCKTSCTNDVGTTEGTTPFEGCATREEAQEIVSSTVAECRASFAPECPVAYACDCTCAPTSRSCG